MSLITSTALMRWFARIISLVWAPWAGLGTWFVLAHMAPEEGFLRGAVIFTYGIVLALMFMGPAVMASIWGKEGFGGGVLLVDGVLILLGLLFEPSLQVLRGTGLVALLTMVLPPLVAGSLFLICHRRSRTSGAQAESQGTRARTVGKIVLSIALVVLSLPAAFVEVINRLFPSPYSTLETDRQAGFNGSFEVVKSGFPANWYVFHQPLDDGEAELFYDSTDPIDGTQSLKLLVHEADPVGGWRSPGLFQLTDAVAGQTYRVSFWLKNRGCQVRLLIDSEFPESSRPTNPIEEIIDAERTGDDTWREFVYTYTVPEPYRDIRFELNVVAPGTLWIDDVKIEPLPEE